MGIKDLETRIIEKADKELQARISAAFKPAETICRSRNAIPIATGRGARDGVLTMLSDIKDAVFSHLRDKNREEALAEFLTQVESLQEQINELRDGVEV